MTTSNLRAIEAWLKDLETGCSSRGIDRLCLTTDQPLDKALFDYLTRRAQV